jgi:hypothetical protein
MMSAPSACCASMLRSGVKTCREPSRYERKILHLVGDAAVHQREDLEAARVGEHRAGPVLEAVQPAEARDQLVARLEVQVVGVAQDDLRAVRQQLVGAERLHGGARAHRHEHRRLHVAVRGAQRAGAGAGARVARLDLE